MSIKEKIIKCLDNRLEEAKQDYLITQTDDALATFTACQLTKDYLLMDIIIKSISEQDIISMLKSINNLRLTAFNNIEKSNTKFSRLIYSEISDILEFIEHKFLYNENI